MTPEYIMEMLRQRSGLSKIDTSEDERLLALSPQAKLAKVCGWQFGDPSWAIQVLKWAEDCGFEIKEADTEARAICKAAIKAVEK